MLGVLSVGVVSNPTAAASVPKHARSLDLPLDTETLAALPQSTMRAQIHGHTIECSGVTLVDLLRHLKVLPVDGKPDAAVLDQYLLVQARDGYRVVFAVAELDPATGDRPVLLANQCQGKALDDAEGPLRLLVPDDRRAARSVRQISRIQLLDAPD
ncbi:molybdopterin-binding protein [Ahniella affigens]|uniref:Molybdopterin-binding protein n=2 Tax=Ahniella affigens TaxID=2021234 RepID=A0A2P1PLY1_9GAMM|nr:molybdopterin-binding protein [Ahniella affigens]